MVRTFKDNFEYIEFITLNELKEGEIFCSNFIPSALFPKDIIDYFFDKKECIPQHKIAADKLWRFGRNVLKNLKAGKISVGFEFDSLKKLIEKGIVHEATKNFEVSFSIRIQVIDNILNYFDNLHFLTEPTPYIFRLIPPDTVILDVDRNKTEQTIQGVVINDKTFFKNFENEYKRLIEKSRTKLQGETLKKTLADAKISLKNGMITIMNSSCQ